MAKTQWTVRVINYRDTDLELSGVWIEQLRYLGMVRELQSHLSNPGYTVLEFSAPRGVDSQVWARQNAERMQSFGIDAAAAPKWLDDPRYPESLFKGKTPRPL